MNSFANRSLITHYVMRQLFVPESYFDTNPALVST
jgi:hypothetical protein